MIGAIIGDLAGSIYEYNQFTTVKPISCNNLIENNAFFSDDTILTIAIADAILTNQNYEEKLKYWARKYENHKPNVTPYFEKIFSPNFIKWVNGTSIGNSCGNGAMMRISPIGYYFNNEKDIIENTILATKPSHNSEEAITHATTVALIIYYARNKLSKEEIINKLKLNIKKPHITKFNYTCKDTIDICLYSLFTANSFEESIKLSLSFGGDTDTNACIVGSMAEAMFGIDDNLKKSALSKLPIEFTEIIDKFYKNIEK